MNRTYHESVDIALKLAGNSDKEWNTRFKLSLDILGLKLSETYTEDDRYIMNIPFRAPHQFGEIDGYPINSRIIYKGLE